LEDGNGFVHNVIIGKQAERGGEIYAFFVMPKVSNQKLFQCRSFGKALITFKASFIASHA
jgi:hypothetical protein